MAAALATNPDLAAARARLNATREAVPQARSEALPQLSASADATRTNRDNGGAGQSVGGVNVGSLNADESETWGSSVSASQLLFAGGRVAATVRQARARVVAETANLDDTTQSLLVDVTSAYAEVRRARAAVDARRVSVENLEEQLRFNEARFEAGVVTRTDVAQAQARLAQSRTQYVQAQGALAAATETYARLVGAPPGALDRPESPRLPDSLPTALAVAGEQAPALRAAVASEAAAEAALDAAKAGGRARLSLEAGAGLSGDFAEDSDDTTNDSVGLRLAIPLFQGGLVRSQTREQRALERAARFDRASVERQVRQRVTTAWTDLSAARAALESAQEQVRAAEVAFTGVTLERDVGLRTTAEILDQEQDLLEARLAAADAERALIVAERALLAATGTLTSPQ